MQQGISAMSTPSSSVSDDAMDKDSPDVSEQQRQGDVSRNLSGPDTVRTTEDMH